MIHSQEHQSWFSFSVASMFFLVRRQISVWTLDLVPAAPRLRLLWSSSVTRSWLWSSARVTWRVARARSSVRQCSTHAVVQPQQDTWLQPPILSPPTPMPDSFRSNCGAADGSLLPPANLDFSKDISSSLVAITFWITPDTLHSSSNSSKNLNSKS